MGWGLSYRSKARNFDDRALTLRYDYKTVLLWRQWQVEIRCALWRSASCLANAPRVCAKHRSGEHGTRPGKKPVGSVGNPFSFVSVGLRHHRVRRRMFHGNRSFGSGYCTSYRFSWRNFLFPDEFDCFNDGFLFDPFLYGRSLNTYFWSDSLTSSGDSEDLTRPPETVENNLTTSAEQPGAAVAF